GVLVGAGWGGGAKLWRRGFRLVRTPASFPLGSSRSGERKASWGSFLRFGRPRHLPVDLIEHEPVAGENRREPRRIRIGVVAVREQDIEVIVVRGPPRPIRWVVPIRRVRR